MFKKLIVCLFFFFLNLTEKYSRICSYVLYLNLLIEAHATLETTDVKLLIISTNFIDTLFILSPVLTLGN